jgi:hypothetical protein
MSAYCSAVPLRNGWRETKGWSEANEARDRGRTTVWRIGRSGAPSVSLAGLTVVGGALGFNPKAREEGERC